MSRFLSRRERLLDFAQVYASGHPFDSFTPRMGRGDLCFSDLTDEALERIASDMAADFWSWKRRTRENRAIYVRQLRAAA